MISSDIRVDQVQCRQTTGNRRLLSETTTKDTSSAFFNGLTILNRFKFNLYVSSTYRVNSYHAENTLRLHYKDQPLKFI